MLNAREILVGARSRALLGACIAALGALLAGCGQKGALYLPTEPEAKGRATLPQTLRPTMPGLPAAPAPAPAASGVAQ